MQQLPIPYGIAKIGQCTVCAKSGLLNARICRTCESHYGRRTAELLARARQDKDFAQACLARMAKVEQLQFVAALGVPAQRGHGPRPGLRKCKQRPVVRVVGDVGT